MRGRANKESLPWGSRSSPGRSAELGFTPSLGKLEMEKEVGRRRARSLDERVK